jgi:hypothetical protein
MEGLRGGAVEDAFAVHVSPVHAAFECPSLERRIAGAGVQLFGIHAEWFIGIENNEIGRSAACEPATVETENPGRREGQSFENIQERRVAIMMKLKGSRQKGFQPHCAKGCLCESLTLGICRLRVVT